MRTEYVFYSGGFDTTAYLLDCLISKKIKVQPIIIKVPFIDGTGGKRRSVFQEQVSRNNFYTKFKDSFPHLKNNLLEEVVFDSIILNVDTLRLGKEAFDRGIFSREINQLLYFHQVCLDNNFSGAVGYQKDDNVTAEGWKFFNDNFKFSLPIQNYSKQYLLERAIKNGYDNFLYETWSCWDPQPNNTPCGKCALCRITIVETKLKFPKKLH